MDSFGVSVPDEEDVTDQVIEALEDRISALERQVFGDEIDSKVQQNQDCIEEIIQVNGQIQRAVASRETISQLLQRMEEIMELVDLEEGSDLLGGEAKANAILAAELSIRAMHPIVKEINLTEVNNALSGDAINRIFLLMNRIDEIRPKLELQKSQYEKHGQVIRNLEAIVSMLIPRMK